LKVTTIEQDPAIGTAPEHVFVCKKSLGFEPENPKPLNCSGAVANDKFVTVNVWVALETPITVEGKVRLTGVTLGSETSGAVVPVSDTAAVGALLKIFSVPVNVPAVVGAHCRFTVQVVPGASVVRQLLVWEKLASPEMEMLLITNGLKPVLERRIDDVMVWPGEIDPNVTVFPGSVRKGSIGAGGVPVRASEIAFNGRM
jgi:hypothetical protein